MAEKKTKVEEVKVELNPYHDDGTIIKRGSIGEKVNWLQWYLVKGKFLEEITGVFDELTEDAVKTFQEKNKLVVSGKIDTADRLVLIK